MALLRQRQLRAPELGQLAGLHQQGPGERPDGADRLLPAAPLLREVEEVAPVQFPGDGLCRSRRGPPRLRAHRDPAKVDLAQHGDEVSLRRALHVAPSQLDPVERRLFTLGHVAAPPPVYGLRQLVLGSERRLGRRGHELAQTLRQIRRDEGRRVHAAAAGMEEEAQGQCIGRAVPAEA